MKQRLLLLFTLLSTVTLAQVPADHSDSADFLKTVDTLSHTTTAPANVDMFSYSKLDSIRTEFNTTAHSIHLEYHDAITAIKAQTRKINQKIDSLKRLALPTRKYKKKLTKLSDLDRKARARFNEKLTALKAKTTDKLNTLDFPPEHKAPLEKLSQQIKSVSLDNEFVKLPAPNIPGYNAPSIDAIPKVPSLDPLAKGLEAAAIPNVQAPAEISEVTQQLQEYQDQLHSIPNTDITNAETMQKTVELQSSRVEGIDELQKQSGYIDGHKTKFDDISNRAKDKNKAVELAKKAAVDHFAGKEEQLKSAMEKISVYKQKYSSVSSIKDLPKRPPNAMKGKPLIERLIPGVYFQYQQKNFYLVDVNPYIAYRISGRFATGLGWNHRFAYDKSHRNFYSRSKIFGPRAYLDFRLGKGFRAHLEGESMNSFVPSTLAGNPDTGQRQWVWNFMTGVKKQYKIYKNLKGTALIQYNWLHKYYKAPYVDRLNSRIGFEYTLKQNAKKTE